MSSTSSNGREFTITVLQLLVVVGSDKLVAFPAIIPLVFASVSPLSACCAINFAYFLNHAQEPWWLESSVARAHSKALEAKTEKAVDQEFHSVVAAPC